VTGQTEEFGRLKGQGPERRWRVFFGYHSIRGEGQLRPSWVRQHGGECSKDKNCPISSPAS